MTRDRIVVQFVVVAMACCWHARAQQDIGSAFTYQGTLENGSGPVTDTCDFRFGLWNADAAGAQVGGSPLTVGLVDVVSGSFTVSLDFGAAAINGDARWLEIEVQCPGDAGFTMLSPRVELTPAPHATRAVSGVGPPNAIEIDSLNGRVGIGTAAPIQPLHVVGTVLSENPGTSPAGSTVRFGGPSSDPGVVIQRGDGVGGVARQWEVVVEHTNDLEIRDNTAGSVERMVIDTTGRVGIGTITPGEQLTVNGTIHSATGGFKFPDGTSQATADTGDTLTSLSCALDEIAKWNGSAWVCSADNDADTDTLAGLGCASGEIAKWNGSAWVCSADSDADTDTLAGLACASGEIAKWDGATWACAPDSGGDGHSLDAADGVPTDAVFVNLDGNVGIGTTTPAARLDVSGNIHASGTIASGNSITIDGISGAETITSTGAIEIHTATGRILRLEPNVDVSEPLLLSGVAPNIIGGWEGNELVTNVGGATISGGGFYGTPPAQSRPNRVSDHFGTVGGGTGNIAGDDTGTLSDAQFATIGGGRNNRALGSYSTVAGGASNTAGLLAAVGGGGPNDAMGESSTIGGGFNNDAIGRYSTVIGGRDNIADGELSTVLGGLNNQAGGSFSLAAGYFSRVRAGDEGTFVWADSTSFAGFFSTGPNQFLIRASGGVGIGTNAPTDPLTVAGVVRSTTGGFELPDGTIIDAASDYGDITTVTAGTGLTGGGASGAVTLNVNYAGSGAANTSARSDHYHSSLVASDGSPSDAVVVDASGNVGIGMDPTTSLSVLGVVAAVNPGSAPTGSELTLGVASSDPALILERGDGAGNVAQRWDIAIESNNRLEIRDTTAGADRIVIDNSGRVAIGTPTPSAELHVVGDIVYTGTITDISDERLKSNIAPVEDARKKLRRLRGVYFAMNDTPEHRDVGLIAQDVLAVLPEAVSVVDPEKGYLGVAYPSVIPLLVEAIKEQDTAIEDKDCRMCELERRNRELEDRLTRLEAMLNASHSFEKGEGR